MPLECCMICVDSSNHMRNGDLNPTRLQAQQQSVTTLARHKMDDNAESSFGLLTMAGNKVDVHISPSREYFKLVNQLKTIRCGGEIDILTSLKVSQLTLRNRINKYQKQRVVLFIGSPILNSFEQLEKAGKELKKNNVAVDIVLFGLEVFTDVSNLNIEKALKLVSTANVDNSSHLVVYYEQQFDSILADLEEERVQKDAVVKQYKQYIHGLEKSQALTDIVIRSAIGRNVQAAAPVVARPIATPKAPQYSAEILKLAADLGMDPSELDDDLIEAIKASMDDDHSQAASAPAPASASAPAPAPSENIIDDDDEMDEDLRLAILMSLGEEEAAEAAPKPAEEAHNEKKQENKKDEDDFDELLKAVSGDDKKDEMSDKQ